MSRTQHCIYFSDSLYNRKYCKRPYHTQTLKYTKNKHTHANTNVHKSRQIAKQIHFLFFIFISFLRQISDSTTISYGCCFVIFFLLFLSVFLSFLLLSFYSLHFGRSIDRSTYARLQWWFSSLISFSISHMHRWLYNSDMSERNVGAIIGLHFVADVLAFVIRMRHKIWTHFENLI